MLHHPENNAPYFQSQVFYTHKYLFFKCFFCLTYAISQIILNLHRMITDVRFETLLNVAQLERKNLPFGLMAGRQLIRCIVYIHQIHCTFRSNGFNFQSLSSSDFFVGAKLTMTKRLCLFAGYSKENIIEDYVIYYIKKLSEYADVYYCSDCDMPKEELLKIKPYTKLSIAKRHKKYDFGSWGILYDKVPDVKSYDELILANDSMFGPLYPLENIFQKMKDKDVSAWSLCANKFMMSFFVVLKPEVFTTDWFKDFITNIKTEMTKYDIVRIYEKKISAIIEEHGLKWGAVFSKNNLKTQIKENQAVIKEGLKTIPFHLRLLHRFRPNKTRVYDDDFFILFLLGMPLIKKQAFFMSINHFSTLAPLFIKKYTDYNYELIGNFLDSYLIKSARLELLQKLIKPIKNFVFEKKYKGRGIVYRICKIKVYEKKHKLF